MAMAMAMGNAAPPPSRDLATTALVLVAEAWRQQRHRRHWWHVSCGGGQGNKLIPSFSCC